jgi:hypothetical protein
MLQCELNRPQHESFPSKSQGIVRDPRIRGSLKSTSLHPEQTRGFALFGVQSRRIRTMGIFTKDIKPMEDLFLHQLEDIYYAEQQLTKAIPKMAEMATNADLTLLRHS